MRQITEQDELDKAHPSCVLVSSTGNINWGSELKYQPNQLPMDVLLEYEDVERLHDRLVNRDDQGDIGYTAEDIEKMGAYSMRCGVCVPRTLRSPSTSSLSSWR